MGKTPTSLSIEAIAALEQGNKIEAIKIYRKATGTGLKESKEDIEAYLVSNPVINEKFKQSASSGGGKAVIILFIIAAAVWWFKDKI
jgi:ribosomal protein L7/L12